MPQARPEIRAAKGPLTTDEFKRALEQGLGRAILCLKKHDPTPYKQIVLEACLKDLAYPRHFFYNKAPYFVELLDIFEDSQDLKNQILNAFQTISPDEDERPSRELILEFAKTGLVNAREALYKDFVETIKTGFDKSSGREIVKLDGLKGLMFIARFFGGLVGTEDQDAIPRYYVRDFSDSLGAEVVNQAFLELDKPKASKYLEFSRKSLKSRRKSRRYEKLPYEWAARAIEKGVRGGRVSLQFWGQDASEESLIRVAQRIPEIRGVKKLERALSVFAERPFPLDYTLLLELCRHKDENVVWAACQAVSWFSDSRIRELALEFLENPEMQRQGMYLLELNFEQEDWNLLENLTANLTDDHCEKLIVQTRKVIETNPSQKALKTLLQLYEAGSCVSCRLYIVEVMNELNCLPDWVLEEMSLDAHDYAREKSQAWLTPKTP
jgi:hypothetical protein